MSRPACAMRSAMASSVPSPPSTTIRSTHVGSSSRERVACAPIAVGELRGRGLVDRLDAPLAQPRAEPREMLRGGKQTMLGNDADASDACCHGRR